MRVPSTAFALFSFSFLAACSGAGTQASSESHAHEAAAPPAATDAPPPPALPADDGTSGHSGDPHGSGGGGADDHAKPLATTGDDACTFDISYTNDPPADDGSPLYTLTITKRDTRPGTCTERKGKSVLVTGSYEPPVAFAASLAREKLLVVTFDGRYSATSAIYTRLVQIDWATGQRLHEGEMAVRGTSALPPPAVLRPRSVAIAGRDVLLRVNGPLPGAGSGDAFEANYSDFLGTDPQPPTPAAFADPL